MSRAGAAALVVLTTVVSAPTRAQEPDDPVAVAWARAEQEQLPALEQRARSAELQVRARRAWFAGEGSFEDAFPHLVDTPLNQPPLLRGRLVLLDDRAKARSLERGEPVPDLGRDDRARRFATARSEALDAEQDADELERRQLLAVLARLDTHPALKATSLTAQRAELQARIDAASAIPADAAPEVREAAEVDGARAATQLAALDRLVVTLLRRAAVPTLPPPAPDDALAALAAHDDASAAAASRLSLLVPFLPPAPRAEVEAALVAWWGDDPLAKARASLEALQKAEPAKVGPSDVASLTARLAEAESQVTTTRQRLDRLVGDTKWLEARRQVVRVELQTAELRRDRLKQRLADVEAAANNDLDAASLLEQAQKDAVAAAEAAEAARANAADAVARRRAELFGAVARASERQATLLEARKALKEEVEQARSEIDDQVAEIDANLELIRTKGVMDPTRPDPDIVNRSVRTLTNRLRQDPASRGHEVAEAEARLDLVKRRVTADTLAMTEASEWVADDEQSEGLTTALRDWESSLDKEIKAASDMYELAVLERDHKLRVLHHAREQRRELSGWLSPPSRLEEQGHFLEDILDELALFGPSVVTMGRGRIRTLIELPGRLLDWNFLRNLVLGSFWTIVAVFGWLFARGRVEAWARQLTMRLHRVRPELRPRDLEALRDPVARFLRAFIDLLLGWLLVDRIGEMVPELGFVLRIYLQVALFRALLAFYDLVVVPSNNLRPALLSLREVEYRLLRFAVRVGLIWFIARRFTLYVVWEVLGLDRISGLIAFLFTVVGIGLTGWVLYLSEPVLRARVSRRQSTSPVVTWLQREDKAGPLFRVVRSVGILVFFVVAFAVDLSYLLARERSSVAAVFNAVSRYRLTDDGTHPTCSVELREELSFLPTVESDRVPRKELEPTVSKALAAWQSERRRGMVAVVADRHGGKEMALTQLGPLFHDAGLEQTRARIERRMLTEGEVLGWLAGVAGVEPSSNPEILIERLEALEPRVFLVEGIHRAFLRKVQGFDAITALLYVLNATCDRHFWVVSCHGPMWDYFANLGSLVDVSMFHSVVTLAPLTVEELNALTTARARAAGYTVDYSALARHNPLGGDPAVEQERAVHLFFRLLGEAALGNLGVALKLWARCLEPTPDNVLKVHMSNALSAGTIKDLNDPSLFVLVALRVQDELTEEELVDVTNIGLGTVRTLIRDLQGRALVERGKRGLRIPDIQLPAVTRTLRRRHFLHQT